MYLKRDRYPVMDNEPQLGTIEEIEIIVEISEVVELVIEYILEHHEIPKVVYGVDDYTDEKIELIVGDYL